MESKMQFNSLQDIASYIENNNDSVLAVIDLIQNSNKFDYPTTPYLPRLKSTSPTESEVIEYVSKREKYDSDLEQYRKMKTLYDAEKNRLDILIEEFIKDYSGLNDIPEMYRGKVYSIAYSDVHSYGMAEVYNKLTSLVEIFN